MTNCNEMNELMSLYIDKALDSEPRKEFEAHIDECKACREELQELAQLVELCNDISEEELPEDFKEKLHERLMEERNKEEKKNRFLVIRNRYVRIAASIAAVAVITIVLGGVLGSNFYLPMGQSKNSEMSVAETKSMEAPLMENAVADRSMNGNGSEKTSRAGLQSKVAGAGSADLQITSNYVLGAESQGAEGEGKSSIMMADAAKVPGGVRNSVIQIASAVPQETEEKVRSIAASNQAAVYGGIVVSFSRAFTMQAPSKAKTDADNQVVLKNTGENTIRVRLPKDKTDSFITELKTGFGEDLSVEVVSGDASAVRIEELNTQLAEISHSLQDNESRETEDDRTTALQQEKEWIEQELQSLQNMGDYVFVTVTVLQK
jgi:hypothetical protein